MSVEIQEFLSGSSSSPLSPRKEKAPQVNANESVKIPIRIKKLYNHNGEPSSRGELSKKNIEKTLNKKY